MSTTKLAYCGALTWRLLGHHRVTELVVGTEVKKQRIDSVLIGHCRAPGGCGALEVVVHETSQGHGVCSGGSGGNGWPAGVGGVEDRPLHRVNTQPHTRPHTRPHRGRGIVLTPEVLDSRIVLARGLGVEEGRQIPPYRSFSLSSGSLLIQLVVGVAEETVKFCGGPVNQGVVVTAVRGEV